ncbi:MAG: Asp-tRNA(Asn)/Glu-tRNA(Gln) amidotransferase subunit GatC [Bacteroidetes bacterium]|jgi:aspartyl-tRNA(Asn)/glutamyl-tRNA(Gln) amidotransferase subunit C|nr:MAG: Asp-tRNA(Asn)/Glu-tRNA(Gln) amidotransferase subunit GatC [Bacteroidota bacterium]
MQITDELLQKLADLARLDIPEADRAHLKADLQRMFNFVDKLQELDTSGVEPLIHMTDELNVLRPDEPSERLSEEEVFRNAPDSKGAFFRVPKVVKK